MPGAQHLNGWEVAFLVFVVFVVPLLAISVVVVGIGGWIYWAVKRALPPSRFVRVCMVLGTAMVALSLALWLAGGAHLHNW